MFNPSCYEQLLNYLTTKIRGSLELQTVLDTTVEQVRRVLRAERAVICRLEGDGVATVVSEDRGEGLASLLAAGGRRSLAVPGAGVRASSDLEADPDGRMALVAPDGRAAAAAPIAGEGGPWGLLVVHHQGVRSWRPKEIDLLAQVAEQLAVAVAQAGLHERVRQQAAREALVYDIVAQVRSTLDLETILTTATGRLREALGADRVVAYRFTREGGFCCNESVDERFVPMLQAHYALDCIPPEYLERYREGRVGVLDDLARADLSPCHVQMLYDVQVQAYLIVPIVCHERLWGLLAVHQCSGPRRWQSEEIQLLQAICSQVATAVEHAALLAQAIAQKELLVQQNAELREARQAAEEGLRARNEFLAVISHELRTPFNGILGALEMVLADEAGGREHQRELLELCRRSAEDLLRIVNNILDLSRLEQSRLTITTEDLTLVPLVERIAARCQQEAEKKSVDLAVAVAPELTVHADVERLAQVLEHILGNAVKFTHQGQVRVRATREGAQVCIEVDDTGIGIAPEQLGRLAQPFVQVDSSLRRPYGGTGLGLVLARRLAELMGGSFAIKSAGIGRGTTVQVRLPVGCAVPV